MEFNLEGQTYVELNRLLKFLSWAESGGEAHQMIDQGVIKVNGEVEHRRRKKLYSGDLVHLGKDECKIL